MKNEYDAIVIGSGFGGSVMALRLAEKGKEVCLLERGRQWTTQDFFRQLQEFLLNIRALKLDRVPLTEKDFPFLEANELRDIFLFKEDGLFEFKFSSTGMHAVVANGVGGGSLIYASVLMETPPDVFQSGWPRNFALPTAQDYDRVREELRVGQQNIGVVKALLPGNKELPKTEFLRKAWVGAGKRGRWGTCIRGKWEDMPDLAHQPLDDPNPDLDVPHDGPQKCISCANCILGCRRMAKNTLDSNYIKRAIEKGAHLYPSHEVTAIKPLEEGGYWVICERQHRAFKAKTVVLAAGALGSTKLLLQCQRNGDLPDLSRMLGRKFSGNGDFQAGARQVLSDLAPPQINRGPIITSSITFTDPGTGHHKLVVEDGGVPRAVADLVALLSGQMGEIGYLKKLLKNFDFSKLSSFTPELGKFSAEPTNTLERTFMFLCAGRDGADGQIRLKPKWPKVESGRDDSDIDIIWNWENPQSQELYRVMESELRHLVEKGMGGAYFAAPVWELLGHLVTVHPLGGCPMGDDIQSGVVNANGQVFGYPGLYVADGSIMPAALGVNPSLTIAALAERIAQNIP